MSTNSADVAAGDNATAAQYNNLRKDVILAQALSATETDGATVTVDWSDVTRGKLRSVTLAGNRALAFSNPTVDQWIILNIIQDGTGNRTITSWPATMKYPGATAPTLSKTANAVDTFIFHCTAAGGSPAYRMYIAGVDIR